MKIVWESPHGSFLLDCSSAVYSPSLNYPPTISCHRYIMIYAFLIHSAESVGIVHFSHFYTSEGNDHSKPSRQQTIVRKVIEDKTTQQHSASYYPTRIDMHVISPATLDSLTTTKKGPDMYSAHSAAVKSLPVPTEGLVLVRASRVFEKNLITVWRQFGDLIFSITCERGDNLQLVSNALLLIIEQICRKFGVTKLHKLIEEEPDTVEQIITPHTRLSTPLIINHSLHRFMSKENDSYSPFFD